MKISLSVVVIVILLSDKSHMATFSRYRKN